MCGNNEQISGLEGHLQQQNSVYADVIILAVVTMATALRGLTATALLYAFCGGQLNNPNERVTEVCLGCICEAMSGCNLTRGCAEDDCGMFRITKLYWVDAGQPTLALDDPNTEGAYQRCVLDPICAARTVRGYMVKFIDKECDGDGEVTCMDYAASHFNGGYSCHTPLDSDFLRSMRNCLSQVSGLAKNS